MNGTMKRVMRRGWFYESFRHSLSARGISTGRKKRRLRTAKVRKRRDIFEWRFHRKFLARKYAAFKDDRGLLGNGQTLTDVSKELKQRNVDVLRNEVIGELQENEGRMWRGSVERFMEGDFLQETNDYLNNTIDKLTYERNVRRKLRNFIEANSNDRIGAFDWAEGKK